MSGNAIVVEGAGKGMRRLQVTVLELARHQPDPMRQPQFMHIRPLHGVQDLGPGFEMPMQFRQQARQAQMREVRLLPQQANIHGVDPEGPQARRVLGDGVGHARCVRFRWWVCPHIAGSSRTNA
jgi:hypothetical protein